MSTDLRSNCRDLRCKLGRNLRLNARDLGLNARNLGLNARNLCRDLSGSRNSLGRRRASF